MNSKNCLYPLILLVLISGCHSELYHAVEERDVNEMVVALETDGIEASKIADPEEKGSWILRVPTGVRVDALKALAANGLPKPKPKGYDAFYPSDGLIPTADEEHVLQQFALSQEIRKSLLTIDGIVDAQVNLVIPKRSKIRLTAVPIEPSQASLVVKYRTAEPPTSEEAIKQLVSASVPTLAAADVVVLMTRSQWASQERVEPVIVSVGPISVAAASKGAMQSLFIGLILIIVFLSGGMVFILVRRRR